MEWRVVGRTGRLLGRSYRRSNRTRLGSGLQLQAWHPSFSLERAAQFQHVRLSSSKVEVEVVHNYDQVSAWHSG